MDIPLNVSVVCQDGQAVGRSTYVILDPLSKVVTHVVVQTKGLAGDEYLVPLDRIIETAPDRILLRCEREDLSDLQPFKKVEFVGPGSEADVAAWDWAAYQPDEMMMWPYVAPGEGALGTYVPVEQVPPEEMALRRGTRVQAADGAVGRVDEFLINPETGQISHLVLRQGHLWGQRDVTIPLSAIDRIEEDTVYLSLDKKSIERLPSVPVRR